MNQSAADSDRINRGLRRIPQSAVCQVQSFDLSSHALSIHSSIKNQRSSPIRPFLRTSARQAFSFGLLAFHLARISLSFCVVNFFDSVGVVDGLCAGAGVGEATIRIKRNAMILMNLWQTMNFSKVGVVLRD